MGHGEVLHAQGLLLVFGRGSVRVKLVQLPADHGGNDGLLLQFLAAETGHYRTVPHHRGTVGQRIDLSLIHI